MKRLPQHGIVPGVLLVSVLILGACSPKSTPTTFPEKAAAATDIPTPTAPAAAVTDTPTSTAAGATAISIPGPCDPALSAISIQGGSDFENTAVGFLTGYSTGNAWMSSFTAPSEWSVRHLSSDSQYYRDPERATGVIASDADANFGIDQAMLLFYAGHGEPERFWTVGELDKVEISDVRLGNCSSGGMVRYLWQCSCQVYAHGPNKITGTCGGTGLPATPCYDNPGGWTGAAAEMNVYDRWGPALDPSVRMACGASTNAHCEGIGGNLWENLTLPNIDIADAFILGIWNRRDVGLCLTLGGENMADTPLVTDQEFSTLPNTSGNTRYHIEYAQDFISTTYSTGTAGYLAPPLPSVLPVFALDGESTAREGGTRNMNVDPKDSGYKELAEAEYVARAEAELKEKGLSEEFAARPEGVFLRLASTPVKAEDRDKENPQRIGLKTVIVTYRQQLDMLAKMDKVSLDVNMDMLNQSRDELSQREIRRVPVVGGAMSVQLNNDGSLRSITKQWFNAGQVTRMVETKPYEAALNEARNALGLSSVGLEVGRATWGYAPTRETGNPELAPYYVFWFEPKEGTTSLDYPPQVIRVRAEK